MPRSVQPLTFAIGVLAVIVAFLALDHFSSLAEQIGLGALTWLILIVACEPLDSTDRARVVLVVLVATGAEILGSIVLGAYTYRLENLPAFVPPGHGLVFLAGLRVSQSAPVRRHRRAFLAIVIGLIAVWSAAGLLVLSRLDLLGAVTGALLIWMLVRGRNATLYAGVFLVVAFLELYGTGIGAWHWSAQVPGTAISAGNPPSGIAGVYVLFDIAAIALAPHLLELARGRLLPGERPRSARPG